MNVILEMSSWFMSLLLIFENINMGWYSNYACFWDVISLFLIVESKEKYTIMKKY
jgi:hypothetical protein